MDKINSYFKEFITDWNELSKFRRMGFIVVNALILFEGITGSYYGIKFANSVIDNNTDYRLAVLVLVCVIVIHFLGKIRIIKSHNNIVNCR